MLPATFFSNDRQHYLKMLQATGCQLLPWWKADFRHEIRQISPEMLQNVRDACYYPFAICQERNGAHFEHLLH
jgi:hypothetical protein